MQSDPASKPMAVTVYRLTPCPHCNAANGVTAIRCWSCDQPLADKRWTGEVSEEELAPAREPALSDADFTFLDNDLLARQKHAAVEDAVATALTFSGNRAIGPAQSPPRPPPVVERLDDDRPSQPRTAPQQPRFQPPYQQPHQPARAAGHRPGLAPPMGRGEPVRAVPLPPGMPPQMLRKPAAQWHDEHAEGATPSLNWPPRQSPEALAYDQPIDYDQPLPFADGPDPSHETARQADAPDTARDDTGSPFSVRNSAIGAPPGAAFRKGRRVEALVLALVLGAGLYAYLQPSPEDTAREMAPANRQQPAIDAETQRLLDLSAPAASAAAAANVGTTPPIVSPAHSPAPAPAPAAMPAPLQPQAATPAPTPAPPATAPSAARPAPIVSRTPAPVSLPPAAAAPTSEAAPRLRSDAAAAQGNCAAHVAALGLC